jgi:hypothetical protein
MLGEQVCHLLQVSRVIYGNGTNNITNMMLTALMHHGGLLPNQVEETYLLSLEENPMWIDVIIY